jgi:hypothetical protein
MPFEFPTVERDKIPNPAIDAGDVDGMLARSGLSWRTRQARTAALKQRVANAIEPYVGRRADLPLSVREAGRDLLSNGAAAHHVSAGRLDSCLRRGDYNYENLDACLGAGEAL